MTCSVLPQENGDQVRAFTGRQPEFSVVPPDAGDVGAVGQGRGFRWRATYQSPEGLLMTPRRTGTDGFFVSV